MTNRHDSMRREFVPFFSAAANRQLSFPFCETCERFHWYPMIRCPHCRSQSTIWRAIEPLGRLYSWSRVDYPFDSEISVPYWVGLLEFDAAPGVRLITNLINVAECALVFDQHFVPDFHNFRASDRRLCFMPA
ncbi:MAG: OB-fold domain-containing protein [Pseudomonadota bacterium]